MRIHSQYACMWTIRDDLTRRSLPLGTRNVPGLTVRRREHRCGKERNSPHRRRCIYSKRVLTVRASRTGLEPIVEVIGPMRLHGHISCELLRTASRYEDLNKKICDVFVRGQRFDLSVPGAVSGS